MLQLRRRSLLLWVILRGLTFARTEDEEAADGALLVVYKRMVEKYAVEGRNLTIATEVTNLGGLPATKVRVDDGSGLKGLKIIDGSIVQEFESVAPGATAVQNVVVVSESERVLPGWRSTVEYTWIDLAGDEHMQSGYSSAVRPIEILTAEAYRRVTGNFWFEWAVFALGSAFPVLLPLLYWLSISTSNDKAYSKKRA